MATDWKTTYNDVCNELDIYHDRYSDLQRELDFVRKELFRGGPGERLTANYDGMPKAQYVSKPFDHLWGKMQEIELSLSELQDVISLKTELKRRIEYSMGQFQGVELRVASLMARGYRLYEIADELDYSYNWIRKIAAKINKQRKGTMTAQIS